MAVVLYGPKAAGKSRVGDAPRELYGVVAVDADDIVLGLLADGRHPDPEDGWLTPIEQAVTFALRDNAEVSVEATGAWDSDWQLARNLEAIPARVLRVWVSAPLEVTMDRLARRTSRKAPTTPDLARWIHAISRARSTRQKFDLSLDTGLLRQDEIPDALAPLAPALRQQPIPS